MIRVGLVGARGYVGRELIWALELDSRFDLAFASSRAMVGKPLSAMPGLSGLQRFASIEAVDLGPDEVAAREVDVIVLGLPNGLAAPYVEALGSAEVTIVDLSADYRHVEGWAYGSPELNAEAVRGARRVANPGCYATAANLALAPLMGLVAGPVSVFGVSGYSGAGTTPGQRNDPERLEANVIPYGFGGHGHQAEIAKTTGLDITFAPHVAGLFRGLIVTAMVPLKERLAAEALRGRFEGFYEPFEKVEISVEPPDLGDAAGRDVCIIGGFAVSNAAPVLTLTSALDNLGKGAATQAVENIALALGLD